MEEKAISNIARDIMNIQVGDIREIMVHFLVTAPTEKEWKAIELAYKVGHRDARHSSCQIAIEGGS